MVSILLLIIHSLIHSLHSAFLLIIVCRQRDALWTKYYLFHQTGKSKNYFQQIYHGLFEKCLACYCISINTNYINAQSFLVHLNLHLIQGDCLNAQNHHSFNSSIMNAPRGHLSCYHVSTSILKRFSHNHGTLFKRSCTPSSEFHPRLPNSLFFELDFAAVLLLLVAPPALFASEPLNA